MPMNTIQFQRGLSLPHFVQLYGSEHQCEQALIAARWPNGWHCPRCNCKRSVAVNNTRGRARQECLLCGYQCSIIVGTVMEHSHLPLRIWFLAMYLLTQHKNAISALSLKRQLGVSYQSAWLLKHKLMHTMQQRDEAYRLEERVEIDDAYLGGERAGSIHGGRKAENKTAFIAAVQTLTDGRPMFMRLTPVADFTNQILERWARRYVAPGCVVVSDGTLAFKQVSKVQAVHERHITGGGRQGAQTPQLHWVNTMLGNLKSALAGTYHSFKHRKYARRYLAEFCYRFNRRFNLAAMVPRLLAALAQTSPLTQKALRSPELCS